MRADRGPGPGAPVRGARLTPDDRPVPRHRPNRGERHVEDPRRFHRTSCQSIDLASVCAHICACRRGRDGRLRDRARRGHQPGLRRGRDRRPRRRPRAAGLPQGRAGAGSSARRGSEYSVRIRNINGGRLLAVTSVDGVNVISGETASPAQSGYVLDPYACADIAGWRKNLARTAAFYFTELPDSYAARTGRPDNVGVIGVAVFRERIPPVLGKIGQSRANELDGANAPAAYPPASRGATRGCGRRCGGGRRRRPNRGRRKPRRRTCAGGRTRNAASRPRRCTCRPRGPAGGQARHRPRPQRDLARADGGVRARELAAGGGRSPSATTAARTWSRWACCRHRSRTCRRGRRRSRPGRASRRIRPGERVPIDGRIESAECPGDRGARTRARRVGNRRDLSDAAMREGGGFVPQRNAGCDPRGPLAYSRAMPAQPRSSCRRRGADARVRRGRRRRLRRALRAPQGRQLSLPAAPLRQRRHRRRDCSRTCG